MKVTISGSFRKFPRMLRHDLDEFKDLGAVVLSPQSADMLDVVRGFATLKGDPVTEISRLGESKLSGAFRAIENYHLNAIASSDLLWLTMPDGYCGNATSLEIGCAVTHSVPVYARAEDVLRSHEPVVLEFVTPVASIAEALAMTPRRPSQARIDRLHLDSAEAIRRIVNPAVAVGAIVFKRGQHGAKDEFLTVGTYKWGGRFSIVGNRVSEGDDPRVAVLAAVKQQTGLEGRVTRLVSVANMIPASGYYDHSASRMWVDFLVEARDQRVALDHRADRFEWAPLDQVFQMDVEPNARATFLEVAQWPEGLS